VALCLVDLGEFCVAATFMTFTTGWCCSILVLRPPEDRATLTVGIRLADRILRSHIRETSFSTKIMCNDEQRSLKMEIIELKLHRI